MAAPDGLSCLVDLAGSSVASLYRKHGVEVEERKRREEKKMFSVAQCLTNGTTFEFSLV